MILDFWATWCGPCVQEMPLVAKVAEQYRDKGVALYCVNQGEEADEIQSFLDAKGLKVTVSLDPAGQAASAYGVEGIPTLVLIDQAGVVHSVHVGFRPDIDGKLKAELDAILAGKEPTRRDRRRRREQGSGIAVAKDGRKPVRSHRWAPPEVPSARFCCGGPADAQKSRGCKRQAAAASHAGRHCH